MPALLAFLASLVPLAQAPIHTFHGDSPNDEFGVSVAIVGDANRDGYADILVGAHWDDNNGSNSGSARLFSGVDGAVLGTFNGDAQDDFFGLAVAGVGDVNFDGFDDFAVGADSSDFGGTDAGLVRVFSGKTSAVLRNLTGSFAGAQIGAALARVDGTDLLLVGAPASDRAIAVSAATGAIAWTFFGAASGDRFGAAVASGRDLDGDGVPDYAIGAPNDDTGAADSGSVTLFSGSNGNQIRVLRGLAAGDQFGSAVALLPDSDGDGRGELVVGAPRANGPGSDAGAVYLYSGASGSLVFSRAGEAAGDQFGTAVASMATFKGNPEPVFVVGARLNDLGGSNAGAAYVYSALNGALVEVLRGQSAGDWFGGAVAGGGDVDGNGIGDLVVSARLADVNGSDSGSVEVHASPLLSKTWYVDAAVAGPGEGTQASPFKSIQFAINRGTTRSGDTILVQPGTYFENLDFVGKSIALVGNGGAGAVVLDGRGLDNCIKIQSGEGVSTRVRWLKIINGSGDYSSWDGGGGLVCSALARVEDCIFESNQGNWGAAVATAGDLYRCTFINNGWMGSSTHGGAVSGARDIIDCEFTGNTAYNSAGALLGNFRNIRGCTFRLNQTGGTGGAIAGSFAELRDSVIEWNSAGAEGGGIYLSGDASIENCRIANNSAGGDDYLGGGLFVDPFYGPTSVVVRNTLFEGNRAAGGGAAFGGSYFDCEFRNNRAWAISFFSGLGWGGALHSATATRCVLIGNEARGFESDGDPGEGGAAYGSTLVNCTMIGNIASKPNVGPYPGGGAVSNCSLLNCIAWQNIPDQCFGTTTATYSTVQGGWPGAGNLSTDPLFVNASVGDVHLTASSPCIDTGDPMSPLDPDGSRADMGAFPFDPNYCPTPFTYCTAKVNSIGCTPSIGWSGAPTLSSPPDDFHVTASNVLNQKSGIMIWSTQPGAAPLGGGTLCLTSPVVRAGGQSSGGSPVPPLDCSGQYSFHISQAYMQNYFLTVGQTIYAQWWSRDPGFPSPNAIGLTNGLAFVVCP